MTILYRPATAPAHRLAGGRHEPCAMRDLPLFTWLPVGSLLALIVFSLVAPTAVQRLALPIAMAGAGLGVPHGAVDHLVPWWWGSLDRPSRAPARSIVLFAVGYGMVAAVALIVFFLAPTPSLVLFLVVSAVHFGRGEVVTSAERSGRPVPGAGVGWPASAAFGSAVVGLLLWGRPLSVEPYLRSVSPWLADATTNSRLAGLTFVALMILLGFGVLLGAGQRGEAVELGIVVVAFLVAPPLAAFGVYFGLWHAIRHTGRLLDLAQARSGTHGGPPPTDWTAATRTLSRASFAPTVTALAVMVTLWARRDLASLQSEVAVLLALTFPHAAVVWALDSRVARGNR